MKTMVLAVGVLMLGMSGMVFAEAETPVIDQRQANQEKRIDQGIASGQLNEREANRLNKQQEHINKIEDKAKADGVVTKGERARIDHAQDRASRHIAREKHDRQGKRHQ
jgi:opacity protein-like surface antigen